MEEVPAVTLVVIGCYSQDTIRDELRKELADLEGDIKENKVQKLKTLDDWENVILQDLKTVKDKTNVLGT